MKKFLVCCVAVVLCLYSCRKEVESVSLSDKEVELTLDENTSYQLKATVNPKRAAKELVWETSRKNVATVSEDGLVQAKGTGYCIITAKAGDKSDACKVWVYDGSSDLQSLAINKDTAILYEGQKQQFTCAVRPSFISVKLAWTSSDTNVLKVDQTGVVTACKAGAARITVKAGDKSDVCSIVVKPIGMALDRTKDTLVATEQRQLKLTLTPAITSQQVKWSTTNASVATVSATGLVTAVGGGTAVIKATLGTSTVQCEVVVKNAIITMRSLVAVYECRNYTLDYTIRPASAASQIKWTSDSDSVTVSNGVCTLKHYPAKAVITAAYKDVTAQCTVSVASTKVTVSETQVSIRKEQTYQLYKTTLPAGDSTKVTWSTSNSNIAKVSSSGLVTAVSAGTAYITATLNGCRTSVCTVSVKTADVTLNKDSVFTLIGHNDTLKATVLPSSSAGSLTWSSTNTSIATVSSTGVVTGKAAGTAVIKATVGNVVKACTVVVTAGTYFTSDGYKIYKNGAFYSTLPGYCTVPKMVGTDVYTAIKSGSIGSVAISLYRNNTLLATSGTMYDLHNNQVQGLSVCADGTVYIAAIVKPTIDTYKYRIYKYTGGSGFSVTDLETASSYSSIRGLIMEASSSSYVYTYLKSSKKLYINGSSTAISGTIECMAKADGGTDVYMAGKYNGSLVWYKNGTAVSNHGMGTSPFKCIYISDTGDKYGITSTGGNVVKNGSILETGAPSSISAFAVKSGVYYYVSYANLYKSGSRICTSLVFNSTCMLYAR